jgi:hypothetical protein
MAAKRPARHVRRADWLANEQYDRIMRKAHAYARVSDMKWVNSKGETLRDSAETMRYER